MKFNQVIEKMSARKINKQELFGDEKEQFMVADDKFKDFAKLKDHLTKSTTIKKKGNAEGTEFAFYALNKEYNYRIQDVKEN
jgi:hypothetical protein